MRASVVREKEEEKASGLATRHGEKFKVKGTTSTLALAPKATKGVGGEEGVWGRGA